MLLHPEDEKTVTIYQLTRRNITKNFNIQQYRCENRKSQNFVFVSSKWVNLGGLVVSVLRGFDPDRGRWIFKGDKNPEHHFLRRGSKAVGPMS
jgi:hypothetical protein